MINDLYLISEKDKNEYLNLAERKLSQFSKDLPQITILFEDLYIDAPIATYANFRDALFHFLKMRSLGDEIQILQEMYAMEEHLHRSLKDTVISLFQHLSISLEYLIHIMDFNNDKLRASIDEKTRLFLDLNCNKTIADIKFEMKSIFDSNEKDKWPVIILYTYNKQKKSLYCNRYRKMLHQIKNECLTIRSVSLSIERPIGNEKSVKYYIEFYYNIIHSLKEMEVFEYLPFAHYMYKIYADVFCV